MWCSLCSRIKCSVLNFHPFDSPPFCIEISTACHTAHWSSLKVETLPPLSECGSLLYSNRNISTSWSPWVQNLIKTPINLWALRYCQHWNIKTLWQFEEGEFLAGIKSKMSGFRFPDRGVGSSHQIMPSSFGSSSKRTACSISITRYRLQKEEKLKKGWYYYERVGFHLNANPEYFARSTILMKLRRGITLAR